MASVLAPNIPEHPVIDGHLLAYQERNIDKFAAYFSSEIRVTKNGSDNFQGIDKLREIYGNLFSVSPNLRVRISARRIEGENIFDTEHVWGWRGGEDEIVAQAHYKVVNEKIIEMHLKAEV